MPNNVDNKDNYNNTEQTEIECATNYIVIRPTYVEIYCKRLFDA